MSILPRSLEVSVKSLIGVKFPTTSMERRQIDVIFYFIFHDQENGNMRRLIDVNILT